MIIEYTEENSLKISEREAYRDSNLELYRIIVMLLIVAHHYVVNSGLIETNGVVLSAPLAPASVFLLLFGAWGKTGINCFVLITGYFMCKSDISARKFVKLLGEVIFYKIVIYMTFLLTGYETFSAKGLLIALLPVRSIKSNFIGCFLVFYLCIPFVNILIKNLSEHQHIILLLLVSFVYVGFGTLHRVTFNYVTWFIALHLIASYIRLYPKRCFDNTRWWGLLTVCFFVSSCCSVIAIVWIRTRGISGFSPYAFVSDSNTFLALMLGISSFLFFKNVSITYSPVINGIASSTFGVLLIHANSDTMRRWLWKDLLDNIGHYGSPLMPVHAIGSVIGIFLICVAIDKVRILFIERPFLKKWDMHWPLLKERVSSWLYIWRQSFCKKF